MASHDCNNNVCTSDEVCDNSEKETLTLSNGEEMVTEECVGERSYDISPDEEMLDAEKQVLEQEFNEALKTVEETGCWREKLNNETEVFMSKE